MKSTRIFILGATVILNWGCTSGAIRHEPNKAEVATAADSKSEGDAVKSDLVPATDPAHESAPQLKPVATDAETAKTEKIDNKIVPAKAVVKEAAKEPIKESAKEPAKNDGGVAAATSLGWLKHGNIRFVKNALRADGQNAKDRSRLVSSQHPHAIILSCSDSRVPPELVFDQKLGEVFVVRTAGESLDSSAIASIEYAVEHLGPKLLVVMGHEKCGAIQAAIETPVGKSTGSPHLDYLVSDLRPHLKTVWDGHSSPSENLVKEVLANTHGVANDLIQRSEIVRNKVASGALRIETAVYHLQSGEVDFQ